MPVISFICLFNYFHASTRYVWAIYFFWGCGCGSTDVLKKDIKWPQRNSFCITLPPSASTAPPLWNSSCSLSSPLFFFFFLFFLSTFYYYYYFFFIVIIIFLYFVLMFTFFYLFYFFFFFVSFFFFYLWKSTQFCKSDMSKYRYLEVFQRVPWNSR